ncbi:MAG: hypothetical protein RBS07_16295 [Lentimicrobium sp.]|jgi:hypothetical protein|nr:hypothetical protein [Lentimicrobium sp.]
MKNLLLLTIFSILINATSCEKDPCKGEPETINYNEIILIEFINQDSINVFQSQFNIDSLMLTENENQLKFTCSNGKTLKLSLETFSSAKISNNFNNIIECDVLVKFDSSNIDTLIFKAKPVLYKDQCDKTEYEFIELKHNSATILHEYNVSCFSCGSKIITIKL